MHIKGCSASSPVSPDEDDAPYANRQGRITGREVVPVSQKNRAGTLVTIEKTNVKRGPDGELTISLGSNQAEGSVAVYAGVSPDAIDHAIPVMRTAQATATISGLDSSMRYYFRIVPDGKHGSIVAERILPLKGAPNFRDLGGYETTDGRRVKWGKIYRSGNLAELTAEDVAYLANLRLKTVFDLRSPREQEDQPNRLPATNPPHTVHVSINDEQADPYVLREKILAGDIQGLDPENRLIDINQALATNYASELSALFKNLCEADRYPALLHCTIGKDRTGFVSAVLLLALGVPMSVVLYDYQLTNRYTVELLNMIKPLFNKGFEILQRFLEARPAYLQAGMDMIDREYGSFEAYLRTALNFSVNDQERLRDILLE